MRGGPLNAGSNDSAEITVEARGSLTLHWGMATQGVDAELAGSQFELTRLPVVNGLTVSAGLNGEVNAIAARGELMTDTRFGAGLPSSALDTVGWNAVATQSFTDGFSLP